MSKQLSKIILVTAGARPSGPGKSIVIFKIIFFMMKSQPFSVKGRMKSFRYAWEGILSFVRREHNAWLHVLGTMMVFITATLVGVSKMESLALVFAIGFVWVAEIFNTCVERIMDFISVKQDAEIKFIKDLAAGAVLIAAITALAVGGIIFIPKLFIL